MFVKYLGSAIVSVSEQLKEAENTKQLPEDNSLHALTVKVRTLPVIQIMIMNAHFHAINIEIVKD